MPMSSGTMNTLPCSPLQTGFAKEESSPPFSIFFYGNQLFAELRRSGYDCFVNGFYHGIFGYSDDNMLLAPSEYALQKMLEICENFAGAHNLQFSTDRDPIKCKTKCIAFTRKPKPLKDMKLCGNNLPWVDNLNTWETTFQTS